GLVRLGQRASCAGWREAGRVRNCPCDGRNAARRSRRLAGIDIQTLRDCRRGSRRAHRSSARGRPPWLSMDPLTRLHACMKAGADPEKEGRSRWRIVDAVAWVKQTFGISYSEEGMRRILHALGHQKTRRAHRAAAVAFWAAVARLPFLPHYSYCDPRATW